jgi:hypothetical protein
MLLFFRILSVVAYSYFCFALFALQESGILFLGGLDITWQPFFSSDLKPRVFGTFTSFIIFFFSERHIRKNLVNDTIEPFTKIIDTAILVGAAILASILVVINLIRLINNLVDFESTVCILQSVSQATVSFLFLLYPFAVMKARDSLALASRYLLRLQQVIVIYIVVLASVVLPLLHPILVWKMNHDIELRKHIDEISNAILAKKTVYDDVQKFINDPVFAQSRRFLKSGEIRYKKKNEEEFELSCEFETDQQEVLECKKSKTIARRSKMFLDKKYCRGWSTMIFNVQQKAKK